MKEVTVVIPTRNRLKKLERTLRTIPDLPWIRTWVVCDDDFETARTIERMRLPRTLITPMEGHRGSVACRNAVIPACPDGVLYAVDDIDFLPGCIEAAFDAFNREFQDDDGVVGICQVGHDNWHPSGVALLGKAFIARYPKRQPFCPDYWHFAAQEIYWLANKLGRFFQCKEALIRHYHPDLGKKGRVDPALSEADSTHREARLYGNKDRALRHERKRQGLIWGDTAT